jgi:outer membrane protein assembly factor BamB
MRPQVRGIQLVGTAVVIACAAAAVLAACQPADRRGEATPRPAASVAPSRSSVPVSVGRVRWSVDLGDSTDIAPAFADGVVFVSTHHGRLVALDARSGGVRWRGGQVGALGGAVTVAAGRLYLFGSDPTLQCELRTFDAAGGAPRWWWSSRACSAAGVTVTAGVVYLGIGGVDRGAGAIAERDLARVVALEADTGRQYWSRRIEGPDAAVSMPVVADRMVYVSSGVALVAIDAASGRVRWQVGFGREGGQLSPPEVHGGLVHLLRTWGSSDSAVYGFDAQTGRRRWVHHAPGLGLETPVFAADTVVIVSQDGRVHALNHRTGQLRWVRALGTTDPAGPPTRPVASGSLVYLRLAGALHAIDARTGRTRWTDPTPPPGNPLGSYDGVVYLGANTGVISAVGPG